MKTVLSLALLLLTWIPTFAQSGDTVTVAKVLATDLIELEDGTRVGLLGITTPKSKAVTSQDCSDHLSLLIKGKQVVLVADSSVVDQEGKTVQRYVYIGGTLVNQQMIADGYARPSKTVHSHQQNFQDAYNSARDANHGAHATERSSAIQCQGTTQRGTQCRRMTTNLSGKCWQHE